MTTEATPLGRSFDAWADAYDRYRPTYPPMLFERIAARLSLPSRPLVADLGAGTGRASLAMAELGWRVTAVEPGRAMLDVLRARATDAGLVVATVQATAEATGLDPASVDLAIAAQAFHWFDSAGAVQEMARIVRPGGGLAVFWNVRDEDRSPFVRDYHTLLETYVGSADTGRYLQAGRASGRERTQRALRDARGFADAQLTEVHHALPMTPEEFEGMAFTASYLRAMDPERQARFRRELAELMARHDLQPERRFLVPYRVDLWTAVRRGP
jgi:SAM-dependent methyltransferase